MTVSVEIDAAKLENNRAVIEWLQVFAQECLREAQLLAGERISGGTGAYERSFAFELLPGSPPKLLFGNTSPIAIYVEEDTEPHDIVPVKRKALRWSDPPGGGPGAAVFAQRVHHPGTTGQHIVRDAVTNAGARLSGTSI